MKLVKSEFVVPLLLTFPKDVVLGFKRGPRQQETNREQEPGAHPLVGETPEGKGPLASPLVGEGAGRVWHSAQCSWCVQWVIWTQRLRICRCSS
jgi:hypothetical protein